MTEPIPTPTAPAGDPGPTDPRTVAFLEVFASRLVPTLTATVREELDQVVPHLIRALKTNDGVDAIVARLDAAERRLAERDRRPIISRVYRLLSLVRRLDLDPDVHETLTTELEGILVGAGFTEFGEAGEAFTADRHEAVDGVSVEGRPAVVEVLEPGLETLGEVVVRARVRVGDAPLAPTAPLSTTTPEAAS